MNTDKRGEAKTSTESVVFARLCLIRVHPCSSVALPSSPPMTDYLSIAPGIAGVPIFWKNSLTQMLGFPSSPRPENRLRLSEYWELAASSFWRSLYATETSRDKNLAPEMPICGIRLDVPRKRPMGLNGR